MKKITITFECETTAHAEALIATYAKSGEGTVYTEPKAEEKKTRKPRTKKVEVDEPEEDEEDLEQDEEAEDEELGEDSDDSEDEEESEDEDEEDTDEDEEDLKAEMISELKAAYNEYIKRHAGKNEKEKDKAFKAAQGVLKECGIKKVAEVNAQQFKLAMKKLAK